MKWLHISDIHYNFLGFNNINTREMLLSKLNDMHLHLDFILITGDCMYKYSDKNEDINNTIKYIKKIAKICQCPLKKVYFCQGNHDVDRQNIKRNNLIEEIRNDKSRFETCVSELDNMCNEKFQSIVKGVTGYDYKSFNVYSPKNANYRIISINTAIISKDKYDDHKLLIKSNELIKLQKKIENDEKLNILIMHHGIDLLEMVDSIQMEHWIEDANIDIVFCGHTHRAALETYDETNRDIKQFTAGALVLDNYAIPSFYLCEYELGNELIIYLYTFSSSTETWELDNSSIRKFKNGVYKYKLSRNNYDHDEGDLFNIDNYKEIVYHLNKSYEIKYNSKYIYLNKYNGNEEFDVTKIISSLGNIKMPYEQAVDIACKVVKQITCDDFEHERDVLTSDELRNIIFATIMSYNSSQYKNELAISCWASRYARKYNRSSEIIVQTQNNIDEKLNYSYIKEKLLKRVIDRITGNEIYYLKLIQNELERMAERILDFLKDMGVFEIREEVLLSLVEEYITQKPHPWIVKNSKHLYIYHLNQARIHISNLQNNKELIISQTEAMYHIFAAFLTRYDKVIGCTETSPISIIYTAINKYNLDETPYNRLPMLKYQVIQFKKELNEESIRFDEFIKNTRIIYEFVVKKRIVTNNETKKSLFDLWNILNKLKNNNYDEEKKGDCSSLERVMNIFRKGDGFIVKSPLRELKNCFWFEPNWEDYEMRQQNLGKQILVCVISHDEIIHNVYHYLFELRNLNITPTTELIFIYNNFVSFTKEERNTIREEFKGKRIKCIFIQEENFMQISDTLNWRNVLYDVICISKFS